MVINCFSDKFVIFRCIYRFVLNFDDMKKYFFSDYFFNMSLNKGLCYSDNMIRVLKHN